MVNPDNPVGNISNGSALAIGGGITTRSDASPVGDSTEGTAENGDVAGKSLYIQIQRVKTHNQSRHAHDS